MGQLGAAAGCLPHGHHRHGEHRPGFERGRRGADQSPRRPRVSGAPTTTVIRNEVAHASELVSQALQLPERALVICLERIRLADGEPVALTHNFLPAALVHLSIEMLEQHGLYELLRASGIRLGSATQRMSAKNASATEARILNETRGTALLTMERIAYDESGRPVEFAQHLYRASRYAFTTSMSRSARSDPSARVGPTVTARWLCSRSRPARLRYRQAVSRSS